MSLPQFCRFSTICLFVSKTHYSMKINWWTWRIKRSTKHHLCLRFRQNRRQKERPTDEERKRDIIDEERDIIGEGRDIIDQQWNGSNFIYEVVEREPAKRLRQYRRRRRERPDRRKKTQFFPLRVKGTSQYQAATYVIFTNSKSS